MLREYIISEAMHALGIATTRSLAVVMTGESIIREAELPGAVLTRVASSHLRVGTFQFASYRGSAEELRALADYALQRHFPEALSRSLTIIPQSRMIALCCLQARRVLTERSAGREGVLLT